MSEAERHKRPPVSIDVAALFADIDSFLKIPTFSMLEPMKLPLRSPTKEIESASTTQKVCVKVLKSETKLTFSKKKEEAKQVFNKIDAFLKPPKFALLEPLGEFKLPQVPRKTTNKSSLAPLEFDKLCEVLRPKATGAYLESSIPFPKTNAEVDRLFDEIATFCDASLPPFRLAQLDDEDNLRTKIKFAQQKIKPPPQAVDGLLKKEIISQAFKKVQLSKFVPKFPNIDDLKSFGARTKLLEQRKAPTLATISHSNVAKKTVSFDKNEKVLKETTNRLLKPKKTTLKSPEKFSSTKPSMAKKTKQGFDPRQAISNFSFENQREVSVKLAKLKVQRTLSIAAKKSKKINRKNFKLMADISSTESESGYSSGSVPSPTPSISSAATTISSVRHVNPNGDEIIVFNSLDYHRYQQQIKRRRLKGAVTDPLRLLIEDRHSSSIDHHQKVLEWRSRHLVASDLCPSTPTSLDEGRESPTPEGGNIVQQDLDQECLLDFDCFQDYVPEDGCSSPIQFDNFFNFSDTVGKNDESQPANFYVNDNIDRLLNEQIAAMNSNDIDMTFDFDAIFS